MVAILIDEEATVAAGADLARVIVQSGRGVLVFLNGVLGAGKTTFCRGMLREFGHSGAVKSPTYTVVEPYELAERRIYHFDLYRLADPEELEYLGVEEYFAPANVCLVEWAERARGFLPVADLTVDLSVVDQSRELLYRAHTQTGETLLSLLKQCDEG